MTPLDATNSALPVPVPAPSSPPRLADVVDIASLLDAPGRTRGRRPSPPAAARSAVTAGHDGRVLSWGAGTDAAAGTPVLLGTHDGGVEALAATASGSFVTSGRDGRILCWRPGGDGPPVELRQRRRELTPALTVVEGSALVTATGQLGVVQVWQDVADGGRPEEL